MRTKDINTLKANTVWVDKLAVKGFRAIDEMECRAAAGVSAYEAAIKAVQLSDSAWVAFHKHQPFCVFGYYIPIPLTRVGVPWLLGTNEMREAGKPLIALGKRFVDFMLTECERLENYVHESNEKSIRWLEYLGFTIDEPKPFGDKQD